MEVKHYGEQRGAGAVARLTIASQASRVRPGFHKMFVSYWVEHIFLIFCRSHTIVTMQLNAASIRGLHWNSENTAVSRILFFLMLAKITRMDAIDVNIIW